MCAKGRIHVKSNEAISSISRLYATITRWYSTTVVSFSGVSFVEKLNNGTMVIPLLATGVQVGDFKYKKRYGAVFSR